MPNFTPPPRKAQVAFVPPTQSAQFDTGRREALSRVASAEQRITRVTGRIRVSGIGEASTQISFPVPFVQRPVVMFTYERTYVSPDVEAVTPTFSGVITEWATANDVNNDPVTWTGATIAMVIAGDSSQQGALSWIADGYVILHSGF